MNKTILYTIIFIVLAVAVGLFIKSRTTNTFGGSENDFAIKDTNKIYRIFIGDRDENTAELTKQPDGTWQINGKYKARQDAIDLLLETANKIDVLYILPDAAKQNVYKELQEQGRLVRFYDKNGKKLKGYQVGDRAIDQQGTHVMMEGSEQPYVVHIPIWAGHLTPRYMIPEKDWRDRSVFEIPYDKIEMVSVEYPSQRIHSFILTQKSGDFSIAPFYETTTKINTPINKAAAQQYVTKFKKLVAEAIKNDIPRQLVEKKDILPFSIVTIKTKDGAEKVVKFYPIPNDSSGDTGISPVLPNGIPERYFATSNDEIYMVQHLVFMEVFSSYSSFF
jgi:hypothetical protein